MGLGIVIFAVVLNGLIIFGMSLFVEWLIVKHILDNPANGLILSIVGAFGINLIYFLVSGPIETISMIGLFGGLLFALLLSLPSYLKRQKNFIAQQDINKVSE